MMMQRRVVGIRSDLRALGDDMFTPSRLVCQMPHPIAETYILLRMPRMDWMLELMLVYCITRYAI